MDYSRYISSLQYMYLRTRILADVIFLFGIVYSIYVCSKAILGDIVLLLGYKATCK